MEVIAAQAVSLNAPKSNDAEPMRKNTEQGGDFVMLLMSALSIVQNPTADSLPGASTNGSAELDLLGVTFAQSGISEEIFFPAPPTASEQTSSSRLPSVEPTVNSGAFGLVVNPTIIPAAIVDSETPGNKPDGTEAVDNSKIVITGTEPALELGETRRSAIAPVNGESTAQEPGAQIHGDGLPPGLKLGHQFEAPNDSNRNTLYEPAELSSVRPVASNQNERQQLSTTNGHDRTPLDWEQDLPIQRHMDPSAPGGAQIPREPAIHHDPEPAAAPWRPTVERLADDIVGHARLSRGAAILQLDPPELGKIKIDLRMEDGKLHAQIIAEGHDSKQLIEAHLPELHRALIAGRLEVADVRVSQGSWSGMFNDLTQGFQHSPQGRQESGWDSHESFAAKRESQLTAGGKKPLRAAGRVSMWA